MFFILIIPFPISDLKKKFIKISDNEDLFWFFILFSICYDVLRKLSILSSVVLVRLTLIYKSSLPLTRFLGKLGVGEDGLYKHTRFWWFKTYTDVHLYHVLMVTLQVIDGIAVQCHLKCVLKVVLAWKITGFFFISNLGKLFHWKIWVSEWLLFNANSAIFQLYHGEKKLIFNEMMMK